MLDILKTNSVTAKQIPVISFSLREVLIHSNPGILKWLSSYLINEKIFLDEKIFVESWRAWRRQQNEAAKQGSFHGTSREQELRNFAASVKMADDQILKMMDAYRASVKLVYPQYVEDVLHQLKERSYRLVCLTNEEANVSEFLKTFQLLDLFEAVIYAGSDVPAKPDPRAFEVLLEDLGVEASSVIHIGTRFETDACGAKSKSILPFIYDPHSEEINLLPEPKDLSQKKVVELSAARENRLREGIRFFSQFNELLSFFK